MEQRQSKQANNAQEVQEEKLKTAAEILLNPEKTYRKAQEVQKDIDKTAANYADKAKAAESPQDLLTRVAALNFIMDYMKSPEDALLSYNLPGAKKIFPEWQKSRAAKYVKEVADATGADPAQIANPQTRTKEQQQLLLEAAGREQIARLEAFTETNYMQALTAVVPQEIDTAKATDTADILKHFAVLYFFALHFPDIQPQAPKSLTDENLAEIKDILGRLDLSLSEYQKDNGGTADENSMRAVFNDFVESEKMADKVKDNLPQLQAIAPKYHTSPNTRVSNVLTELIGAGELNLPVANEGKRREITTYIKADYDNSSAVTLPGSFSEYDRQIQDAICTIWEGGHKSHIFTPDMIYRAMTGSPTAKPSPQQKGAITKSIEKQRRLFVDIDATDEIKMYLRRRGITNTENISFKWNDSILSLRAIEVRNGKDKIKAYYMKEEPVLLSYGKATGKILTSKAELLDIKEIDNKGNITGSSLANTEGHITIKGYLWRRVLVMKHDEKAAADALQKYNNRRKREKDLPIKEISAFRAVNIPRIISFETLFRETGQESTNRAVTKRNREYAFQVLDFWKAKGFIKDYRQQIGKNHAITGVLIDV